MWNKERIEQLEKEVEELRLKLNQVACEHNSMEFAVLFDGAIIHDNLDHLAESPSWMGVKRCKLCGKRLESFFILKEFLEAKAVFESNVAKVQYEKVFKTEVKTDFRIDETEATVPGSKKKNVDIETIEKMLDVRSRRGLNNVMLKG